MASGTRRHREALDAAPAAMQKRGKKTTCFEGRRRILSCQFFGHSLALFFPRVPLSSLKISELFFSRYYYFLKILAEVSRHLVSGVLSFKLRSFRKFMYASKPTIRIYQVAILRKVNKKVS